MMDNPTQTKYKSQVILEDGTVFEGWGFGSMRGASGELVFNTAMTGYTESLTDPSYSGQILTLTYPLIGNYGVPPAQSEGGLPRFFESNRIHIKGLLVTDYSFEYSHWNAARSLGEWLTEYGIPAVYGIDTRAITKHIRQRGVMLGKIVPQGIVEPQGFDNPNLKNLVEEVSCTQPTTYGSGKYKIVLVDCGSKYNIIRCLAARNATVVCVPWDYDFTQIDYDGVMLSNGPGNPQMCGATIANIGKAIAKGKPIFGICLGHQLLSIAAGASTFKLKYGHRSHNQPVQMVGTNRCFITSQNHGYAVDTATLPAEWLPYCVNLNDGTNEGIKHSERPFFSVQFHPEASSGPTDTEFLFDEFLQKVSSYG
jgi:carbamoyl-phosphate synthase small subunit